MNAVRHLVELGHSRIAHVAGPRTFLHSLSRRTAWADALDEAGLPCGPLVVSDFTAAGGAAATEQLLDLAEPPTAVVYANDLMAIAGLGVAHNRGLRVPRDLSVTGFDGTELGMHVHPPLTTVVTNPFAWGQAAARLLLTVTNRRRIGPPADIDLDPARLEVRRSTARPPKQRREPAVPRRTKRPPIHKEK
jgi:DNA-binding LacI/PurR family transcriptional regulator